MPLFQKETVSFDTIFQDYPIDAAWEHIVSIGTNRPDDHCLLSNGYNVEAKIIWMETLRQFALEHGDDLSVLESYTDFREYAGERRPDPSRDQWLWLYSQIREFHQRCDGLRDQNRYARIDVVPLIKMFVNIMARRDAFLPFFAFVPDKAVWDKYHALTTPGQPQKITYPFPYPNLEAAINADAPAKVAIFKFMCGDVTDEEIFERAVDLEKGAVVASMLKNATFDRILEILLDAYTNWEDPTPLFEHILPQWENEIAAWRDPWGNSFFWYLCRRPKFSMDIVRYLPPKILATIETENLYGISPKDLWAFYRLPQD